GVAGITYLGQRDYSLRAWLDPDKLAALNLSAMDVVLAIQQQNIQVAAGQIGQPPTTRAQQFQLTINTLGRLTDPDPLPNILVKAAQGNPLVQPTAASGGMGARRSPADRRAPAARAARCRSPRASSGCATWSPAPPTGPRASSSARSSTTSPARWTASRPWH